ncbi:MFS transporter [Pseudomonadota bacterium]
MPYWRLSAFYFLFFAVVGVLVPYWGLYLQHRGFTAADIGTLTAIILCTKIVTPTLWAWVVDKSGRCMRVVRTATLLALLIFVFVLKVNSFVWLALVMLAFSFFWNACLPQMEATTMTFVASKNNAYGRIRLWGSVGFIVVVVGYGAWIDYQGPASVALAILILVAGVFLVTLTIPEASAAGQHRVPISFMKILRRRQVIAFFLSVILMQASHAPFYAFFTIYLDQHHYSGALIGQLWAFGVICEIGVFLAVHKIFKHLSIRSVLLLSFLTAAIRWILLGLYPQSLPVLIGTQAMHAITFGTFHAAAIQYVHEHFKGSHQHRGQALYGSFGFGLGGALGSLYSGYIWMWYGPQMMWMLAAAFAFSAFLAAYFLIKVDPEMERREGLNA